MLKSAQRVAEVPYHYKQQDQNRLYAKPFWAVSDILYNPTMLVLPAIAILQW